jgi:hypothetical protein
MVRSLFDAVARLVESALRALVRLVAGVLSLCAFALFVGLAAQLISALAPLADPEVRELAPAVTATVLATIPVPTTTLPRVYVLRQPPITPTVPNVPPPMDFRLSLPCRRHDRTCVRVVYGVGDITPQTPAAFRAFLAAQPHVRERTVGLVLNSQGGNLMAGLELGQAIRDAGWSTLTGLTYQAADGSRVMAVCYSACAWAFAGGVERVMYTDGALGVHRFYGAAEAQITADQAEAWSQKTTATINLYLDHMGVSRYLQDLASLTPSEQMRYLTRDEAAYLWLTRRAR